MNDAKRTWLEQMNVVFSRAALAGARLVSMARMEPGLSTVEYGLMTRRGVTWTPWSHDRGGADTFPFTWVPARYVGL